MRRQDISPEGVEELQVGAEDLTEALLGGQLPALPLQAADPVVRLGVLRLPGVGRGDDQEPGVCQHLLQLTSCSLV